MRANPPDKRNLLKERLKPRPSPGQLERRRETLTVTDDETGQEFEITYPFGERPSDDAIREIIARGLPSMRETQERADDGGFRRAQDNPIFERPPATESPRRETIGLTYPGLETLGAIGSAPKNFVQGMAAEGLRNFNELDPEKASPDFWPNVGQALRETFGYQNIRPRVVAGLDAVAANDGARRIGEVSPTFRPGTVAGAVYDIGTTVGGDILPFTPLARAFSGAGRVAEIPPALMPPGSAPSPGQIRLGNATKTVVPGGVAPPADLVPRPRVDVVAPSQATPAQTPQGVGGLYTRQTPEPSPEALGLVDPLLPAFTVPGSAPVPTGGGLLTNTAPEPSRLSIGLSRVGQATREILGVPTAIRASGDFSAVLRQGAILGARRPATVARAAGDMVRGAFSEEAFQASQKAIQGRMNKPLYDKHGLFLSDGSPGSGAEEWFTNSALAERIPVVGKVVAGSNRAMTAFVNRLRADTFDKTAETWKRLGLSPEAHPEEYSALADWLNIATGRGDLGALEKAAPVLASVFHGPRWQASRLQVMNPLTYTKMPKAARVEAIKDIAALASAGLSLLTVAKLSGAKVSLDPRNTDFGKIQIGDTRVDAVGAGFLPWLRFFAEMATDEHVTTGGNVRDVDRLTRPAQEARKKLSPVASYLVDAWAGGDIAGRDFDPESRAVQLAIPMWIEDAHTAMKQEGLLTGGLLSVPGLFGAGLQTFENEQGQAVPLNQDDPRNRPTRIPHRYKEGPGGWIVDNDNPFSSYREAVDIARDGKGNKRTVPAREAARKLLLDQERFEKEDKPTNPRKAKGLGSVTRPDNPLHGPVPGLHQGVGKKRP